MIDRLDHARELSLIHAANNHNASAFDELLNAYMPFIRMLAGRLQITADVYDELVQAGRIGFMEALRKYREEKNTRLMTYAVPWIAGEMKRVLRDREFQRANCVSYDAIESVIRYDEQDNRQNAESLPDRIDLKEAFRKLKEEDQRILLLRYFRGKTQKETALMLNRSQAQISKSERRILDFLRHQMEE